MLILLVIVVLPCAMGLLAQRVRPELSAVAMGLALGWYITHTMLFYTLRHWDTTQPIILQTGSFGLGDDLLRMTLVLHTTGTEALPLLWVLVAVILALLHVLHADYFRNSLRWAVWGYQTLILTILALILTHSVINENRTDGATDRFIDLLIPDLMWLTSELFSIYIPLAFLAFCGGCLIVRFSILLRGSSARRSAT